MHVLFHMQTGCTALDVAKQSHGADSAVAQTLSKAGAKTGKEVMIFTAWEITITVEPHLLAMATSP